MKKAKFTNLQPSLVWVVWTALCTLSGAGCAADATVLSSSNRLSAEAAPSVAAGTVSRVCGNEPDLVAGEKFELLTRTGDACSWDSGCTSPAACHSVGAMCAEGRANVATFDTLDCSDPNRHLDGDQNAPAWHDCQAALRDGHSGEPCDTSFQCAAAADDPCCLEVATCEVLAAGPTRLVRTHVCQQDCEKLAPNPDYVPVTGCASIVAYDPLSRRIDQPCSGDFICTWDGLDLGGAGTTVTRTTVPSYSPSQAGAGLRWCRDGLVLGLF